MQALVSLARGSFISFYARTGQFKTLPSVFSPGALIAGAWAVMQHMGEEYVPDLILSFHVNAGPQRLASHL